MKLKIDLKMCKDCCCVDCKRTKKEWLECKGGTMESTIIKEADKMFPKHWTSMYHNEQKEAIKKDEKYGYEHILYKLSNELDSSKYFKEYLKQKSDIVILKVENRRLKELVDIKSYYEPVSQELIISGIKFSKEQCIILSQINAIRDGIANFDTIEENEILKKALELACEKLKEHIICSNMQESDYFIEQAKQELKGK